MTEQTNRPEKRFSTGAISATVWKNQTTNKRTGEPVEFQTVSLQRRYMDKEGKWQTSNSLRSNDLPKASLVLNKAYEYIVLRDASSDSDLEMDEYELQEV
jgi:hypothetical protein